MSMYSTLFSHTVKKSYTIILVTIFTLISVTASAQLQVSPGVHYHEMNREEGPWAIQVLEIRRDVAGLDLRAALGGESILGIEPLDRMITRLSTPGCKIVAGINGDFYILKAGPFQGDPIGFCVSDGELLSSPVKRSAFVVTEDGSLIIDRFRLAASVTRGDGSKHTLSGINQRCPGNGIVLLTPQFGTATRPQENAVLVLAGPVTEILNAEGEHRFSVIEKHPGDMELPIPPRRVALVGRGAGADFLNETGSSDTLICDLKIYPSPGKILHAVGGGPRLLRNGDVSIEAEQEGISQAFVDTRHPRTALGYNDTSIFLVTVDGRQEGYSAGMNLPELASLLKELGAVEAINLDGGGSTTMWVQGKIRNRPSDGRVRPIANGLLLYGPKQR